jgi:hypothetical protein
VVVKRQVHARSEQQLEPMWDWLQDADFSTAAVRWNRDSRTIVVPFANSTDAPDFPRRKPIGVGALSVSFLQPWFRGVLTLGLVRAMRPLPDELVEPGMIHDLLWVTADSVIRIESINELASFDVEVDDFHVELMATDEIDHWRKHRHGRFLRWESYGGRVDK